jgi:hypothetical protein
VEAARRQRLGRLGLYALGVLGLPLVFFLISLHNVYDYGETSDEAYDQAIGRFYYEDYPKTGFANLDVRLDPLQRNYGAFWDIVDVWSGDVLMNRTGWLKDETAAHHVSVIVVSTLLLGVIFLLGTLAYGLGCGFASQLALLLMPRFIGMRVKYRNEMGQACLAFRWQPPDATKLIEVTSPTLLHDAATDRIAP